MARETRQPIRTAGGRDLQVMREEYNKLLDEIDNMRTKYAALLAKLDLDAGVTDTNYAATLALGAETAKKVTTK